MRVNKPPLPKEKDPIKGYNPKKERTIKNIAKSLMGVRSRPEDIFKKKILKKFLESFKDGYYIEFLYQPGIFYSAKTSIPDVFWIHHGQIYAFETKTETGVCSPGQLVEHKKLEKAGVIVYVVSPLNFDAVKHSIIERCGV